MLYKFNDILPNQIRLLCPAPRYAWSDVITFDVHTFSISTAPSYTALSYVWGTGTPSHLIRLNDSDFAVRQNLWSCLHYLTKLLTSSYYRPEWSYIWVDAICIDQSNNEEKNTQIRMMDRIFSSANVVTAWLGFQHSPSTFQWRETGVRAVEHEDWYLADNVLDIAARPNWSRMWIVQEMILAKEVQLLVSDALFSFTELASYVGKVHDTRAQELELLISHTRARSFENAELLKPLWDVLLAFGACQCQDPRDKVFAILSLITTVDNAALGQYFPDYSLTHDAVVAITVSFLQDHRGHKITDASDGIFNALGATQSRYLRRKLLAASRHVSVYDDAGRLRKATFLNIIFYEREEDASQEVAQKTPRKSVWYGTKTTAWWLITCFGLLQVKRDPHRQALMTLIEDAQRQGRMSR